MSEGSASRLTLARWTLPRLLFTMLVLAVYSPTLFSRRNFAGRDLLVYQLPIEKAVHDAYSRGALPVWISEISGGRASRSRASVRCSPVVFWCCF